jgi:cell division ATPase FtsA
VYPGDEAIFALDIGTRTVIGIVAEPAGEGLRILAQAVVEHASRAMYDGQIHDIPRVAEAVARLRGAWKKPLETGLRRVAVAAAGRALKTTRARAEQEIDPHREIGEAEVRSLELMALAAARDEMSRLTREQGLFYCAGHSR